jgi:uncharacterized protein YjiS (DUF1127 family)
MMQDQTYEDRELSELREMAKSFAMHDAGLTEEEAEEAAELFEDAI